MGSNKGWILFILCQVPQTNNRNVCQNFCRNENNVTGKCDRESCPLANSSYATVREISGKVYLFVKTVERAHLPANLWERIPLDRQYVNALEQIDQELEFFPEEIKLRCKQRLTKITKYLIRMRKLRLEKNKLKLIPIQKKTDRRERTREKKAELASRLDKVITSELMERLKQGNYDDVILNARDNIWSKILEEKIEEEKEVEYVLGREFVSMEIEYE